MKTNSNDKIKDTIRNFLHEDPFYKDTLTKQFTDDDNLIDLGILDSIGIYNLILFLETHLSVSVAIDELSEANFASLNQIEKFVQSKASV